MKLAPLFVVFCVTTMTAALPLSRSRGVLITPDNLRSLASFLDSSVTISDRYIQISTGTAGETLIRVPLAGSGELDGDVSVRLTVAFDPDTVLTSDNDIRIGICDSSRFNLFQIFDTSSTFACAPINGDHEANSVTQAYKTGHVTMHFHPFHRYGACQTGHDGGYVNVARFNHQVDPSNGLNLLVNRDSALEKYRVYYFTVEIL